MAKYLVLGGSGFIGKSLVRHIKDQGSSCVNIDIKESPKFDLRSMELSSLSSYAGCFFLAWDVGGSKYLNDKSKWNSQYYNNVKIISNTFPQLAKSGLRTLFVSSQLAGSDDSPYSLTKELGEKIALSFSNFVVVRQWNAYGALEESGEKSHVISDLVHQAAFSGKIKLLTNGEELRSFIHLNDISRAYWRIMTSGGNDTFDIAAPKSHSIAEIARIIGKISNSKVELGASIGISPNLRPKRLLPNWNPLVVLDEGLKALYLEALQGKEKTNNSK